MREYAMAMQHTRGFKTLLHRSDHYDNHASRMGITTEVEYEEFADDFLAASSDPEVLQFVRPWNGDLVRYNVRVDVFAIKDKDGFIKTCYRPDPLVHLLATNLDYYLDEEAKI